MDEPGAVNGSTQHRVEGCFLVLAYPDNPPIRIDARLLDRVLAQDMDLVLTADLLTVHLHVPEGSHSARSLAELVAPYTRSAPISGREGYEEARRRLAAAENGAVQQDSPGMFFGNAQVLASDEVLYIGDFACLISDADEYARVGAALPLPNGKLQAALALLVVAARERREDLALLRRRISEYEMRMSSPGSGQAQ